MEGTIFSDLCLGQDGGYQKTNNHNDNDRDYSSDFGRDNILLCMLFRFSCIIIRGFYCKLSQVFYSILNYKVKRLFII